MVYLHFASLIGAIFVKVGLVAARQYLVRYKPAASRKRLEAPSKTHSSGRLQQLWEAPRKSDLEDVPPTSWYVTVRCMVNLST